MGRVRRRLRAGVARQRHDVDEGDAARSAGVRARQHHRSVAARRGHGLRRGDALQAAGQQAVSLQDVRLREDVDEDRRRHPRHRLHPRHPRGSGTQGPALRRHRNRRLRLVRRRRPLAVDAAQPAGGARPRPDDQGRRPHRGHARPVVLGARQRGAAAPGDAGHDDRRGEDLPAADHRALRPRRGAGGQLRGRLEHRRRQSASRRRRAVLSERQADGSRHADDHQGRNGPWRRPRPHRHVRSGRDASRERSAAPDRAGRQQHLRLGHAIPRADGAARRGVPGSCGRSDRAAGHLHAGALGQRHHAPGPPPRSSRIRA